jgi:hypothetical protein
MGFKKIAFILNMIITMSGILFFGEFFIRSIIGYNSFEHSANLVVILSIIPLIILGIFLFQQIRILKRYTSESGWFIGSFIFNVFALIYFSISVFERIGWIVFEELEGLGYLSLLPLAGLFFIISFILFSIGYSKVKKI